MRFDLVVNTMTRSALTHREILVHGGGTNHRPLISVDNVAMAHVHAMLDPNHSLVASTTSWTST